MSRKKDANKYWIYGEDAALAAQFTAYLATVLKNRRLTYIRHLKKIQKVECSYEYAAETIEHVDSIREESLESAVEAKLMWEAIKPYLHKLSPKECEVMICLYIDRLSIADTATKLKIKPDTVSTHKHNAINKIRNAMGELLAQAKKANHTAIQKLYERYYTLLRSYSFVNGRFDEDLFQTQVIEFLIAVSKFRM